MSSAGEESQMGLGIRQDEGARQGEGTRHGDEASQGDGARRVQEACQGDGVYGRDVESEVRTLLNAIVDPCSAAAGNPMGLVDMGLIRNLVVCDAGEGRITVRADVRVTDPNCMMGIVFTSEVRKRLDALPAVASHDVRLSHEFDWTPDDVTGPGADHMREVRRVVERRVSMEGLRKRSGQAA